MQLKLSYPTPQPSTHLTKPYPYPYPYPHIPQHHTPTLILINTQHLPTLSYLFWNLAGMTQDRHDSPSSGVMQSLLKRSKLGWGYTHDRRADKYPYPHDPRADKDSYPHNRNVTDDLCSLIKLNVFYSCWKLFTLKSASKIEKNAWQT